MFSFILHPLWHLAHTLYQVGANWYIRLIVDDKTSEVLIWLFAVS